MIELSVLETIWNMITRGGWVMIPIFFLGWFAWTLLLSRYFFYRGLRGVSFEKFVHQWKLSGEAAALAFLNRRQFSYSKRLIKEMLRYREVGPVAVRNKMNQIRHEVYDTLSRSLKLIAVSTSIAPMLGLLGTVSGMVSTFDTIRRFGFGNPALLSDGISEALLTTQAGLLVAFPLMLAYNYLVNSIDKMQNQVWNDALRFESLIFEDQLL